MSDETYSLRVELPAPLGMVDNSFSLFLDETLPVVSYGSRTQKTPGRVAYNMYLRVFTAHGEATAMWSVELHATPRGDTTVLYLWVPTPGPSGSSRGPLERFPPCSLEELLNAEQVGVVNESETDYLRLYWQRAKYITACWLKGLLAKTEQGAPGKDVQLPKRGAERQKWRATWGIMKEWVLEGVPMKEIHKKLKMKAPHLCRSERTLYAIADAGRRGLLD